MLYSWKDIVDFSHFDDDFFKKKTITLKDFNINTARITFRICFYAALSNLKFKEFY